MKRSEFIGMTFAVMIASLSAYAQDTIPNPSDTANVVSADSANIIPDSSDTVMAGTANTIRDSSDIAVADSANIIPNPSDIAVADSVNIIPRKSDTDTANAAPKIADNSPKPMRGGYYGFGIGLSLGSSPIFSRWIDGLPDSLPRIGLDQNFGRISEIGDTMPIRYRVIEPPEEFNYFIPFNFTYYNVTERGIASAGVSFFYNTKQFQSTLFPHLDSADRRVNLFETMRFFSLTFEASYHFEIPPQYFSITGSQQSYFTLMLGASPIQYFTRDGGIVILTGEDDIRLREVADSVQNHFADFSGNGAAISWRAGLTTLRPNAKTGGLAIGIYYGGAFSGWFWQNGKRVMNSHIHTAEDERDHTLSFLSHRIEFTLTLLRSFRKAAPVSE